MICYRDMTFCALNLCGDPNCPRLLTQEVKAAADAWWGGPDAPIAVSECLAPLPKDTQP